MNNYFEFSNLFKLLKLINQSIILIVKNAIEKINKDLAEEVAKAKKEANDLKKEVTKAKKEATEARREAA